MKAGLFDENMSSTTDRDIFTRMMLLGATYAVVDKYLVKVDAFNSRERITNGKIKKAEGLRKFFYKYACYMSEDVKEAFFARAKNLFGIDKESICRIPNKLNIPTLREIKRKNGSRYVVGEGDKIISVRSYQRTYELILKKHGLPHRGFHALRHTFATRALECGMDVKTLSEILGHKNPTVTLKRYAHSLMEHKKDMMNRLGKLFV